MLVASAAAMFGTLSYITRSADELGMGAFSFVAWRGAVGTIAVLLIGQLAVLRITRAGSSAPAWLPERRGRALLVACLLGAVVNIAMFAAFLQTTVAIALIGFYTFPAIVTLAAVPLYGDRLSPVRAAALALSGAGLALAVLSPVLAGGSGTVTIDPIGVGLAITAALCQASFILITGRGFAPLPAARVSMYAIFAAGAIALPLAILLGDGAGLALPFHEPEAWLWIVVGGTWGAAIPTTAFVAGIGLIGPSKAAVLMTIEPLVGIGLAAALLGEQPTVLQILGGAAVLAAVIILQLTPSRVPPESDIGPLV